MIWPNGPAKVLKGLRDFDQQSGDGIEAIAVSRHSFYMAVCTKSHIGLFRLKPFAPTCIFASEGADFSKLFVSHTGKYFAAQSGLDLHIYEVFPEHSSDEIFKPNTPWAKPGPGEALGVRELSARLVKIVTSPDKIVALCPFQDYFVIVGPESMYFSCWTDPDLQLVDSGAVLDGCKVVSVSHSALLSRLCLLCDNNQSYLVHIKNSVFKAVPLPVSSSPLECACFNLRFAKVILAQDQLLTYYSVKDLNEEPHTVELPGFGQIELLEWAPSGLGLVVGHSRGWCILSALGMTLYSSETPIKQCEWSVSGDELFILLQSGDIHCYEIMKLYPLCRENIATPLFYSNNRIVVYKDTSESALPAHPWITVSLPNQYLANSWPIISAAVSSDGRYAALAGSYGLVYVSLSDLQWKVFAERDIMIRANGILWLKDCLVLSIIDEHHENKIARFSTAVPAGRRGFNSDEEQPINTVSFDSAVITMAVDESSSRLSALTQDGTLWHYTLGATAKLITKVDLVQALHAPGRVRAMTCLDLERTLFLIDDRLILVSSTEQEISRRTVYYPVEYHHVQLNEVWAFSGHEMVVIDLDNFAQKFCIELDDYPAGINLKKGLIPTVDARARSSYGRSYEYIEQFTDLQVYLPSLFENNEDAEPIAQKFCQLKYFDDVMESALYHALVEKASNLGHLVHLTKKFCDWKQVVVRCARKIEVKYWKSLFEHVGQSPEQLFAQCLDAGNLHVASEYLMVLQAQFKADPGDANMVKLFRQAMDAGDFEICKQLSEFLMAIDRQGAILSSFAQELDIASS